MVSGRRFRSLDGRNFRDSRGFDDWLKVKSKEERAEEDESSYVTWAAG